MTLMPRLLSKMISKDDVAVPSSEVALMVLTVSSASEIAVSTVVAGFTGV